MIVLIVHMTVKPGTEQECIKEFSQMIKLTHKEPGCVQYIVQQSTENSQHFCLYEQYVDQAAVDAHSTAPYFISYQAKMKDLMVSRTREFFTLIS